MDVLSWNCRGICNDTTTRALKDLISQNRPQIVFLCETKISRIEDFQKLHRALGFQRYKEVLSTGQSGGLAMFWNDEVTVNVRTVSNHHIDLQIRGGPGDFNEILNSSEKIVGSIHSERQMRGFHEVLGYGDLLDLGFTGSMTTWWNSYTQLRLDKAHEECEDVVQEGWSMDVTSTPMYGVKKKIAHTRMHLDKWQRQVYRGRQRQMMGERARLEELMDVASTEVVQDEKKRLMKRLQRLLSQEEIFWKQRSRVTWLKEGDRNTGFFHRKASNRRRKNTLNGLYDDMGVWCDDDAGMERVVSSYFSKMFTASEVDYEAMEITLNAMQPLVTQDMNELLCAEYTQEEIKTALFQMYPTKSPGQDGMPPIFFQHYWEMIGPDVTAAVHSFLHSDLISPFQSAFVPGRLITDNILVANEIAHFVHNKRDGNEGCMALKLDFSKAYNQMEWLFLRKVMIRLGFAQKWIELVMQCVSTVRAEGFSALLQQKQALVLLPGIEGKFLRGAGKDILIRVVAQALPTYAMSVFQLTNGFCEDLEQMCAKFWWGSTTDKRKIHWKTWNDLYNPRQAGGLGFRSLATFNSTMLAKQAWRVVSNPASLVARIYKAKYYPEGSFWSAPVHASPSYSWRSIVSTRETLKANSYWQIGDGSNVSIFSDCWVLDLPAGRPDVRSSFVGIVHKVNELITETGYWDIPLLQELFSMEEVEAISRIQLSHHVVEDRLVWRLAKDGLFSVKTTYSSYV
ncbi:uncharacterized protein LOC112199713 [Rosa chinensis]|uniref:uncharacterized protein LOC112199713 n=1 Tax=Rosa chinensis TaxID=74649 RepID=UPI000D08E2E0|nr:uncharacterized protein LOC112199713 [Rosa chinensis]